MIKENLVQLFADSFKENWNRPAYTDYIENQTLDYSDVAATIAHLHLLFEQCNLQHGDKVALVGKNSVNWCVIYLATITYGAVIVPILHEFNACDMADILEHSESKIAFFDTPVWNKLERKHTPFLQQVFSLTDFSSIDAENQKITFEKAEKIFEKQYPNGYTKNDIKYAQRANTELVSLNYTSGTTGYSKGVMLSGNALAGNIVFGIETQLLKPDYKLVAFLPFAHAYGCAFDFLTATCAGCHIYILTKTPSPQLLMEAFERVRPNMIFSVPMIVEKIYQKKIIPVLSKPIIKLLFAIPLINNILKQKIRKTLYEAFGGNFFQIIVGGAGVNAAAEKFFQQINFPLTIGYGMTECAPLISYSPYNEFVPTSCGKILPEMEVKVIDKNHKTGNGEICVRGEHVMMGYYKNPEATAEAIDSDGWLHTGDLGYVGDEGTIFLRGRSKTMILGSNGQNIYPEEIEAKLAVMPYVAECLIVKRNQKLVALVFPDFAELKEHHIDLEMLDDLMEANRTELNLQVAKYERIAKIELVENEFEKTPKKSIKRFMYK
ncbi:long-chain-fatty-acid--CoA ligase [Bacteroidia bacterium]|nr:long-chain-fatty-acid--CoA ligase [Bacteroidia bacterium]GHV43827.1 long-chain-fatty-acid--CoA ligase [Bacteroidia bacterium]